MARAQATPDTTRAAEAQLSSSVVRSPGEKLSPAPHPTLPHRDSTTRPIGILAALGAVLIWGLTFAPGKIAVAEMGPFTLAVLRFSLALVPILVAVSRLPRATAWLPRSHLPTLTLMGLTGVALFFGIQNLGLAYTSATNAGLIAGSIPAITAALSALVLREQVTAFRTLGIALSMLGIAAIVLSSSTAAIGGSVVGDLLIFSTATAFACYTLLNKRLGGTLPESIILAYTLAFGTIFLLPLAAVELARYGFGPVSPAGWASLLFLALGGSGAAFFCWNAALRRLDATEAATYLNLAPVIAAISSALLLAEKLTPSQLLGGALVILGVYVAGRRR